MIRRFRLWRLQRKMNKLADVLRGIEAAQRRMKMPAWRRQQMWHDFVYGQRGREWVIQILRKAGTGK